MYTFFVDLVKRGVYREQTARCRNDSHDYHYYYACYLRYPELYPRTQASNRTTMHFFKDN